MGSDIRNRPEGALLRTYLTAAGIGPDAMAKPLIGVATVSTQIFSERPDARDLGGAATSGIEASGGIAVRWDTVRSPDQVSWGHAESYNFAWRDQLADFIESWARQQALDGLVLIGDASPTLAGMAMAAARLNLAAVLVTTGAKRWEYTQPGGKEEEGKKKKSNDPFALLTETIFSAKKGDSSQNLFKECILAQDNHASYALDLSLEALGVCLPGMATAPAQSAKRHELAYASGQRVVNLVGSSFSFRRVLSINAFSNAIRLNAALGGAIDVAVHLTAIAHEAGVALNIDLFDKIARETPQVCRLGGVGEKEPHRIEDLERAGGVWAVMNLFKDGVHPTTTICGRGALDLARSTMVKDPHVILSRKPYQKQSGIGVLRGNLALKGAVFLLNQIGPGLAVFRGPVVCFDKEIEAAQALIRGKVKKGSAVVVKGQGPRGGPGLPILRVLPALMQEKGWNKTIPLITDGRIPDTPQGLFISLLSPEGAVQGPLGVMRDGDVIDVNIEQRQLGIRLTDTDLRVRMARWQSPEPKAQRGFLDRYSRLVSEVHEGAILK